MKFVSSFLFLILSCAMLGSCATDAYYIENSTLPVIETRKVIGGVIGKPRVLSLNGRELSSAYHDKKFEPLDETKKIKSRYYTKVVILGPRRPYEITVQVIREVLQTETMEFVDVGIDDTLSQKKAIEIKRALNKSLETYQAVDGDEVF